MGTVVKTAIWPLYPREEDLIPIIQEAVWAPGPLWTDAKNFAHTRIRFPDTQPVSISYNLDAIPAHTLRKLLM
jgi:hypothetical protein